MKRTIINKMEDILEWHCDIIEYLPKNVLLKLYKDAKYICKYKKAKKLFDSYKMYALFKKICYSLDKHGKECNKKFIYKYFKKEILGELDLVKEVDLYVETSNFRFPTNTFSLLRKNYNNLKNMFYNDKFDKYNMNKITNIYSEQFLQCYKHCLLNIKQSMKFNKN